MPLLFVKSLDKDVRLGVWKIEEDVDDFLTSQAEISKRLLHTRVWHGV